MSVTTEPKRPVPPPRNGVDTTTFFATLDVVSGQPQLAQFQWRVESRWIEGTHSQSRFAPFSGAGGVHAHKADYRADADHPQCLVGEDNGPTPVEYVLHALASCLTAGIANIAAARGVDLYEVRSTVEGDIDLQGILGLSKEARNGFTAVRVGFVVKGDAPAEKLQKIVQQSVARSAVFDIITNGVKVEIDVTH